ncbi:dipeptide/oligopeptide/nickel ABC transporter permease/ATP-binding protein [Actinoplanes sp. NPDC023936]|uniref:dipeptide/oligopeptide/nickel ABC transporter permease/ATP-binding protein n=1 Tax=Actinoplanes sp. NPDC023936 TaxID=3154910 RepID=UPI00340CE800
MTTSRRLLSRLRGQPVTLAALAFLALLAVVAVAAPLLAPYEQDRTDFDALLQGPSGEHWLGTDDLGRDTFSRILHGARVALLVAVGSVTVSMLIGVPLGLLLGYRGGWSDRIGSRFLDIADALPGMLLGFAVIAILGRGLGNLMLAIGLIFCGSFARMTRAVTLAEREKLYVDAARVGGLRTSAILFRQVLPNLAGPLAVQAAIFLGSAIMVESALSFLGLGLDTSQASWGGMLGAASEDQATQPFLPFPPGVAIVLTVLAFNLVGDGISAAFAGGAVRPARGRARRRRTRPAVAPLTTAPPTTAPQAAAFPAGPPPPAPPAAAFPAASLPAAIPSPAIPSPAIPSPAILEPGGVLELRDVTVALDSGVPLVRDVSISLRRGEVLGLLGESGSGKSMTARAALGLLPPGISLAAGSIRFEGRELAGLSEKELRGIRGNGIAVVFQDPLAALSPVHTVGKQMCDVIRTHFRVSAAQARTKAASLLERVGVEDPERRLGDHPHQFSGGMAQRVAIAMALATEPRVLIADEATSALDVTTQSQVLDLLLDLRDSLDMTILIITHDLGVVAESCDRVVVMYAGEVVEVAGTSVLFDRPRHPYTAALLAANPSADGKADRLPTIPGRVPPAGEWPSGCHFANRCSFAVPQCSTGAVPLDEDVRCVRATELVLGR